MKLKIKEKRELNTLYGLKELVYQIDEEGFEARVNFLTTAHLYDLVKYLNKEELEGLGFAGLTMRIYETCLESGDSDRVVAHTMAKGALYGFELPEWMVANSEFSEELKLEVLMRLSEDRGYPLEVCKNTKLEGIYNCYARNKKMGKEECIKAFLYSTPYSGILAASKWLGRQHRRSWKLPAFVEAVS